MPAGTNARKREPSRMIAAASIAVFSSATVHLSAVARAQDTAVVPIEILAESLNEEVRCRPPTARLPARRTIDFRVVNRAQRAITFAAPEFFRNSDHIASEGFVLDVGQGRFVVAPASTARVKLRSPAPGEYYYSCYGPGEIPTPNSSGFIEVIPAASG